MEHFQGFLNFIQRNVCRILPHQVGELLSGSNTSGFQIAYELISTSPSFVEVLVLLKQLIIDLILAIGLH